MRNLLTRRSVAAAFALTLALVSSGCSLSGRGDDSSIYVDLSAYNNQGAARFSLLDTATFAYGISTPPSTASGFNCYGVNVTGPGIGDSSSRPGSQDLGIIFDKLLRKESYCSYRGIVTPPIVLGAGGTSEVALQVPPGGLRLVQVVGVNDPLVCSSGVLDEPAGSTSGGGRFFEVGRAVVGDLFGDQSVDVATNWPATSALQAARVMDCGGNCALLDHFNGAATGAAGFATFTKYAQRLPVTAGKYIRSVDIDLNLTVADSVTVAIYSSATGASVPASPTGYSATRALAISSGSISFSLQGVSGYLQAQVGSDYWLVVTTAANTDANTWIYDSGAGANTAKFSGSWAAHSTNAGFNFRVNECGN